MAILVLNCGSSTIKFRVFAFETLNPLISGIAENIGFKDAQNIGAASNTGGIVTGRTNHDNLHVRGYKEEGTTTTLFDMVVLNELDRFSLVRDVIERVPKLCSVSAYVKQEMRDRLIEHKEYILEHGEDMRAIRNWTWRCE